MNRRRFLSMLGLSPAIAATDKKGAVEWFVSLFQKPKPCAVPNWTAPDMNNLKICHVSSEFYRDFPIRTTIRIRKPQRFIVND